METQQVAKWSHGPIPRVVEGVGDAAFWKPGGDDLLTVLAGERIVLVHRPHLRIAKRVARAVLARGS